MPKDNYPSTPMKTAHHGLNEKALENIQGFFICAMWLSKFDAVVQS